MARKHHSCARKSKRTGKKHTYFKGKCRTRKGKAIWKRAHRKHKR